MNAPTTKPESLLDLETLDPVDRPFIRIDGERWDLAVPGDFGLLEFARLDRMNAEIDDIQKLAEGYAAGEGATMLPADLAERLERFLDEEVALVLRAPASVRERLGSGQKLRIVEAFGAASRRASAPTPKPNRAQRRATTRTGARSSPASRGSSGRSSG